MLFHIGLLVIGLIILIFGGDILVRGSSSIALRFKMSPLVVGLTIVAFGTSAPELFISIQAALSGSPDLTMGNVIGSNICNLALVLGVTAVINPVAVQSDSIKIDWPMAMGSSVLLYLLVREGYVNSYEGIVFIIILVSYIFYIIRRSRKAHKITMPVADGEVPTSPSNSWGKDTFYIALGCLGLYFGSEWFVGGAKELARNIGVEERIIGLTVLALGTSLPELVTAIVASVKKQTDLALGNLIGSNIFNILSILGITSIIQEIHVSDDIYQKDMIWMLGITLTLLPMMVYRKRIERFEGFMLLGLYALYLYLLVV